MRRRTQAREFALQILYQVDITHDASDAALAAFWEARAEEKISEEVSDFTAELVKGTSDSVAELDSKISQYATNWQIQRMAVVDRNILRMGCFELMFRRDIPPKVAINEAVELAKKYSGVETAKFVNAVLDKIKKEIFQ